MPLTNSVFGASWTLPDTEHVMNYEVRRGTGQPLLSDTVRTRRLKLFGDVARAEKSQDHSRALQACLSRTPRNWRRRPGCPRHTLLRTVDWRSAPIQSWTRVRVPKGTKQNSLADTYWNSNVTDKLRLIYYNMRNQLIFICLYSCFNERCLTTLYNSQHYSDTTAAAAANQGLIDNDARTSRFPLKQQGSLWRSSSLWHFGLARVNTN